MAGVIVYVAVFLTLQGAGNSRVDDPKFIAFDSRQWHPDCFKCSKCETGLIGRGFLTDEESHILCPDCCKEE